MTPVHPDDEVITELGPVLATYRGHHGDASVELIRRAYKVAADRYAVFFIACLGDETPAWALGAALDPCFTQQAAVVAGYRAKVAAKISRMPRPAFISSRKAWLRRQVGTG